MASDGKGNRKLRAPRCPKCRDAGYTITMDRVRGKLAGPARKKRCARCQAGKSWKEDER